MSYQPADVISAMLTRGTMPALTWYGDGERIELSGKVTAMHIVKILQYLRDDLGLDANSRLILDLPIHWKSILWHLAGLVTGCQVLTEVEQLSWDDVVITNTPEAEPDDGVHLALNLQSLALSWNGPLPIGYEDATAASMRFSDTIDTSTLHAEQLTVELPPQTASSSLAIYPTTFSDVTTRLIGAIISNHNLVIITPENNEEAILKAENATIWDRI
ncbi:hypothetical protein JTE88_07230 [Arcanobacterium phocisimile]|uniref:TIGR03089 family protein n=1 Tax=Arcanobacterium phocisimile TaxID=1302235 RepID=A0ABX7IG86_9ACTO|nr:TIGR03089 family protein [Arcanobacterium phocisimile]QRV01870.1 hypothetical protein JTE88_07230 [Arcanobacterium phocisimile]